MNTKLYTIPQVAREIHIRPQYLRECVKAAGVGIGKVQKRVTLSEALQALRSSTPAAKRRRRIVGEVSYEDVTCK